MNDNAYKLENFPSINFISIDETVERRELLYQKFKDFGITNLHPHIFKRYKDEDHIIVSEFLERIGQWRLSQGSRGPVTSHLKAVKEWYYNTDEEYAFFCEDDLSLETVQYWNFTWQEFFEFLPKDWECVQLSWIRENFFIFGCEFRTRCWCDWSACAYLITRGYAKKLIDTYHSDDKFYLDVKGDDVHLRPENFVVPVVETVMFSSLGRVYSFPLFVEDIYGCTSSYFEQLEYKENAYGNQCDPLHAQSYHYALNWWQETGRNLEIHEIIKN